MYVSVAVAPAEEYEALAVETGTLANTLGGVAPTRGNLPQTLFTCLLTIACISCPTE